MTNDFEKQVDAYAMKEAMARHNGLNGPGGAAMAGRALSASDVAAQQAYAAKHEAERAEQVRLRTRDMALHLAIQAHGQGAPHSSIIAAAKAFEAYLAGENPSEPERGDQMQRRLDPRTTGGRRAW